MSKTFKIKTRMSKKGACNRWFRPKTPQNCRIIYAHVLFLDILVLILNVLPFLGHATLCAFSAHIPVRKLMTRNMLTKKMKKSRCQIWQNVIILLSFCYHLEDWWTMRQFDRHHLACDTRRSQNSLVEIWQMLSFCYHCYW